MNMSQMYGWQNQINGKKILMRCADNTYSLHGVSFTSVVLEEVAFIKQDVWEKIDDTCRGGSRVEKLCRKALKDTEGLK